MPNLAERLKRRRLQRGISQQELARRIDKHPNLIQRYEAGQTNPAAPTVAHIARALNCTTDYLLGLSADCERPVTTEDDLGPVEIELINLFRTQSPEMKTRMLKALKNFLGIDDDG